MSNPFLFSVPTRQLCSHGLQAATSEESSCSFPQARSLGFRKSLHGDSCDAWLLGLSSGELDSPDFVFHLELTRICDLL